MTADPSVSPGATVNAAPSSHSQTLPRWRERPERVAWIAILVSFALFLVLLTGIPLALRALYHLTAVKQPLRFEPNVGTVLLYPPRSDQPIALTDRRDGVSEGSRLETGVATQAVLGLPVNSQSGDLMGTILLYPSTTLEIVRSRRPYFAGSDQPYTVRLRLEEGQVRVFTGTALERPVEVQIETSHGEARLVEGIYAVSVDAESSEIAVEKGTALLAPPGQAAIELQPGLRTWMRADGTMPPPISIGRNLVRGGAFDGQEWEPYTELQYITPGAVEFLEQDERQIARFLRKGKDGVHTEVGIRQTIDQVVNGYDSLVVKLDVKLLWQTLEGAGELSSEFPLRIELNYTDIYGKAEKWGHGFYYRDPRPDWPLRDGQKIDPFVWHTYASPNLMKELEATQPAHIDSIRIYASGWNYEAVASDVQLIAQSSDASANQRNLVRGGAFDGQEWEPYTELPYITPGTVEFLEQDERQIARFFRKGKDGIHTEVGIRQTVEQVVNGYDSLVVKLDVKLLWQTLEGAGELSSEFPLRVEITYTDIYGKLETWGRGFYYQDPRPEWPLRDGQKIDPLVWYRYESDNLMKVLEATRPAQINSIRLYASGWNYEAFASDLELIVE